MLERLLCEGSAFADRAVMVMVIVSNDVLHTRGDVRRDVKAMRRYAEGDSEVIKVIL
jgi:hypothetical protein